MLWGHVNGNIIFAKESGTSSKPQEYYFITFFIAKDRVPTECMVSVEANFWGFARNFVGFWNLFEIFPLKY